MLAEVSVKCGSLPPDAGDLTGLYLESNAIDIDLI